MNFIQEYVSITLFISSTFFVIYSWHYLYWALCKLDALVIYIPLYKCLLEGGKLSLKNVWEFMYMDYLWFLYKLSADVGVSGWLESQMHGMNDPRLRFSYLLDRRQAGSHTHARHGTRKWNPMSCLFTAQLTNQLHIAESSWNANSCSPSQEIPFILWIPKFCYHGHLSLSWARIVQSTSSHPTSLRSILIVSSQPQPISSKWSLSFQFPLKKPHMHSFSPPHVLHDQPISFSLILSPTC